MIDKKLLKLLVCPICKKKLFYNNKTTELICKNDELAFPIKNNIPIMLKEYSKKIKINE